MVGCGKEPQVWGLTGHKLGDKAQVLALAEALGWPFELKSFAYRRTELLTNLLLGPTLAGIVPRRSSPLAPPWPDLIITAGRRNEPVARWIQAQASDRHVRIVHLGRPWATLDVFDLIRPDSTQPARLGANAWAICGNPGWRSCSAAAAGLTFSTGRPPGGLRFRLTAWPPRSAVRS